MIDVKAELEVNIKKVVLELSNQEIEPKIEHPQESFGDYSSNIALIAARVLKTNPFKLAQKIKDTMPKMDFIEKIEVVKPGFINFFLSKDYLNTLIIYIIKVHKIYGRSDRLKDKKIMVEFTDPNPFKEFHIGHLYSNIVGESISCLLESQGAVVKRANYQGDVGMHVAKALYGLLRNSKFEIRNSKLDNLKLAERIKVLGEAYALGTRAYESEEKAKTEIEQLNKKIYAKDPQIIDLYEKCRQWSLEYFEEIYKRLGTKFDYYYFESEVGKEGMELVKEYLKKDLPAGRQGVFVQSQGAVIFPGEKYGLHNRVFINSLGLPTYEAKDLALPTKKYKDFPYDISIIITAHEQSSYFKVLIKALSLIAPAIAGKTKHIAHGEVRVPGGKMSSRMGNIITGEWLIDEAKRLIANKFPEMEDSILEKVAIGAVKYALLKSGSGKNIEFDFNESISFEGNSGPYLQYTFARTQSVLAKIKDQKSKVKISDQNLKVLEHFESEELLLLRTIHRFPEVIEEASMNFAPNLLCNYLFDLAQKFNLFYQKHQILGSKQEEFRLSLVSVVGQVLKNGLSILGIQAPERM